ncbi:hypothetical protein AALM74_01340 [Parabacteroides segnis]|uniref:DUF4906 domain-containing protein n=1 Tax=Parabacteroides segnis TaxID=2763058 RepID=UPI0035164CCE
MKRNNIQKTCPGNQTVRVWQQLACLLAFLFLLPSCSDEMEPGGGAGLGETEQISLPITLAFSPITETKAVTRPSRPGSAAAKAGFHYELEVTSSDTLPTTETKALPTTLKNVVALLFTDDGKYKGKALPSGSLTTGSNKTFDFTVVSGVTASTYRLVIIANHGSGDDSKSSVLTKASSSLSTFTGTYEEFLKIYLKVRDITKEEDSPYVGSITDIELGKKPEGLVVPMYRMLAKITVNINKFEIKDGPELEGVSVNSQYYGYFGTPNNYNGSGTNTTPENVAPYSKYSGSFVHFVGENVKPLVSSISNITERTSAKAPEEATFVSLSTKAINKTNTAPAIGEEYTLKDDRQLEYTIYLGDGSLSDFSVRRNTNYTINVTIDGTLEGQLIQADTDKRIRVHYKVESAGLNIGMFGGGNFVNGSVQVQDVTGYYTKYLLLHPNTLGTTATDTVKKQWSTNTTTLLQSENRKFWDPTYTLAHIDLTTGFASGYCYNLTTGGVTKGTWYVPTQAQLGVIYRVLGGLKDNPLYDKYSAFADYYWSATEYGADYACCMNFSNGNVFTVSKRNTYKVRCVRDL